MLLLAFVLTFVACDKVSPGNLAADSASSAIGRMARVEGTVSDAKIVNGNGFINFGGRYPRQVFTGYIPPRALLSVGPAFVLGLHGKRVIISGVVQMYNGKPQIVVTRMEQVQVK